MQIAIFSWTLRTNKHISTHFSCRHTWISKLSLMRLGFGSSRVLVGMPARSLPKAPSSDRSLRPFDSRSPMPSSELSPPPCCIEGLARRAALFTPLEPPQGVPGRRAVRARARQQATPIPDEMSQKAGLWWPDSAPAASTSRSRQALCNKVPARIARRCCCRTGIARGARREACVAGCIAALKAAMRGALPRWSLPARRPFSISTTEATK